MDTMTKASAAVLDYETVVDSFNNSLLDTLRLHGADLGHLQLWVPDEDIVRSLLSMFESASLSGTTDVSVRVPAASLSPANLERLRDGVRYFGSIAVEQAGERTIIHAHDLKPVGRDRHLRDELAEERVARIGYVYGSGYRLETPPAYTSVLEAYAGKVNERVSEDAQEDTAVGLNVDGIDIVVRYEEETGKISSLSFDGALSPRQIGALEILRNRVIGLPVQEACEHGASRVLDTLRAESDEKPQQGIALPFNSGPEIGLVHKVCHELQRAVGPIADATTGLESSFYDDAPSTNWLELGEEDQKGRIEAALIDFGRRQGLQDGEMALAGLQRDLSQWPVRVVVEFADTVAVERKPGLLRDAERALKDTVEPKLQVYCQELRDANRIRRL